MDQIAMIIGYSCMAVGGLVVTCFLLGAVSYVVNSIGRTLFKRVKRIYHLSVIGYWLDRLEKEGTHVFQKADKP